MNGDKPTRMRKTKRSRETSILSLPYDLLLNCLARISRMYYPTLSLVSKKFRSVVASPELYKTRSLLNRTESCLYLCLRYPGGDPHDLNTYWFSLCRKPNRTVTDRSSGHLFIPIPSPHLRPAESSSIVAVGSNIYKIGGYMYSSSRVSVLDCRFNTWHKAPVMRVKRSSPAASVVDGKIYVAGGGCEDVNSENWVEVFDPKTQTWGNLTNPAMEIPPEEEVKSFGIEGKLYLLGGDEDVVYDPKKASWSPIGSDMDMAFATFFVYGVIGDVMFLWNDVEFSWFDSKAWSWKKLRGVEDLPDFGGYCKIVDLGGKMALLWEGYVRSEYVIWCAEIALEMRDGDEMWGKIEWLDVVLTLHERCHLFAADVLSATV